MERLQQQRRQVPAVLGVGPDANAARTSVQLSDAASAGQQEDYEDADDEDDPYDDDDDDDSSEESGSGQPELGVRSLAAQNGPGAEAVQPAAAAAAALVSAFSLLCRSLASADATRAEETREEVSKGL